MDPNGPKLQGEMQEQIAEPPVRVPKPPKKHVVEFIPPPAKRRSPRPAPKQPAAPTAQTLRERFIPGMSAKVRLRCEGQSLFVEQFDPNNAKWVRVHNYPAAVNEAKCRKAFDLLVDELTKEHANGRPDNRGDNNPPIASSPDA